MSDSGPFVLIPELCVGSVGQCGITADRGGDGVELMIRVPLESGDQVVAWMNRVARWYALQEQGKMLDRLSAPREERRPAEYEPAHVPGELEDGA